MGRDCVPLRWLPLTLFVVTVIIHLASFCYGYGLSYQQEMTLPEENQEGFDKFKKKALPLIQTNEWMKKDICLMKYYKSSEMDHKKALEKLKDNLKFREEYDLDGAGAKLLQTDEWEDYVEEYPPITSKTFDKDGRRIGFIKFKTWDMAKATSSPENVKKFLTFAYIQFDKGYRQIIEMADDNHAASFVILVDMKDTDMMKHLCVSCQMLTKDTVGLIDTRWPGALSWFPIVNLNSAIKSATEVVFTNFIPEKIKIVAEFFDENVANWKEALEKRIAHDQFPKKLFMKIDKNAAPPPPQGPGIFGSLNGMQQPAAGKEEKKDDDDDEDEETKKKSKKKNKKKKKKDDDDD